MSAKKEPETKKDSLEEMSEDPYAPKPYAKKEHIRTRHVQATGTTVEFHKTGEHMYEVECEHGTTQTGSRRYPMARAQSTPDEWCEKCAAAKTSREAEREEKKKARADRRAQEKKPAKAKAKNKEPEPEGDDDPEVEGVIQGSHVHHDGKKATLKAATFASRNGLHWTDLDGTGKGGTVTMGDVEKAVQELTTA